MIITIVVAVICPPLAFLLQGKIVKAAVALVLWIAAVVLALTGVGLVIAGPLSLALIIWAIVSASNARNDRKLRDLEDRLSARG